MSINKMEKNIIIELKDREIDLLIKLIDEKLDIIGILRDIGDCFDYGSLREKLNYKNDKLNINLFADHNASEFPLEHILNFMKDKDLGFGSSKIECEFCSNNSIEYYREEEVFYSEESGFNLEDKFRNTEIYDFSIYKCPKCLKWYTYIE
ncbi:hypothetical protein J2Z35_002909 [Acetoanaerobium pronyense]|uniref:Uncharacterized protein n=1 Tax=Acetoanaerobium pronyense TaxID=1482736 RepID=A0ABS4KPM0_9FIRM|nr:hypothetical protein [Acetoanaerobium pronyense]MBP2029071.1 hypothetical protein [Acetoanaerobium pronyense]